MMRFVMRSFSVIGRIVSAQREELELEREIGEL